MLFDCGEGTQYQMLRGGISRSRIDAVFITHLHGDHVFGLPGLLSTMALLGRRDPLRLIAPAGTGAILDILPGLAEADLAYALDLTELPDHFSAGVVLDSAFGTVEARRLDHRVPAVGYRFQERERPGKIDAAAARAAGVSETWQYEALRRGERITIEGVDLDPRRVVGPARPGMSFAYVTDTRPCDGGRDLARNADLVLHDSTFAHAMLDRAIETGHSTAREAAEVARDAGARRLLLSHFSTRYADVAGLVEEAEEVFPATEAAVELQRYVLEPAATVA
jgi:ribonuclease Z